MIECFDVPLNEREVFSVVLRVATRALLTGSGWNVISRMQSLARVQSRVDFGVAVQTSQRCLPAEFVAARAIG